MIGQNELNVNLRLNTLFRLVEINTRHLSNLIDLLASFVSNNMAVEAGRDFEFVLG